MELWNTYHNDELRYMFSALLAIVRETTSRPDKGPVKRSFEVLFVVTLNKSLNKQSRNR